MKKMSKRCQMSKNQTHRLWRRFTKKINSHNEVHTYWCQFWRQIWRSTKLFKNTFYAHFEGFWSPLYVMSKLTSICVNLIMSIYFFLWNFFIVNVFDFLTFNIFLTTWHLFDNLTSFLTYGQLDTWAMEHMGKGVSWLILKIEMGNLGWWGTTVMGHMGNWAHGHNFVSTWGIFIKILQHIDIDVFYLNIQWFFHDGLI